MFGVLYQLIKPEKSSLRLDNLTTVNFVILVNDRKDTRI